MPDEPSPQSSIILYQTEDGRTRIQCRFEDETVWLTQKLMAELFQIGVGTVNHHLKAIFAEGELPPEATIRRYRIVQNEGARQIAREVEHYNLDAIIAVGFRVRSHRGTQFRQWAIGRLNEYLLKGFTMDDERLKNPPGKGQKDYFDEQLERIRDIRSSERRFYQKVLDIYATSVVTVGVEELDSGKLTPLLRLKYHDSIADAVAELGQTEQIREAFSGFQKYLYADEVV